MLVPGCGTVGDLAGVTVGDLAGVTVGSGTAGSGTAGRGTVVQRVEGQWYSG